MVCSAIWLQRPDLDHAAGLDGEKGMAQACMSGNKSFMRFDFAQRIRIDTLRPVMFCWYLMFRSLVSRTSHRPSASVRSSPFFLDPKPACCTVWHSWPSAARFPFSPKESHPSILIFIYPTVPKYT